MTAHINLLTDRQQIVIACKTYGSAKLSCKLLSVLASHVVTQKHKKTCGDSPDLLAGSAERLPGWHTHWVEQHTMPSF